MNAIMLVLSVASVLCSLIAPPPMGVEDRSPSVILAEINKPVPNRPTVATEKALQEYKSRTQAWYKRRAELIGELYSTHPETPELADLLPWRWNEQIGSVESNAAIRAEIHNIITVSKQDAIIASAYYYLAILAYSEAKPEEKTERMMPFVNDFCKRYPKNERGGNLLMLAAGRANSLKAKEDLWERALQNYSTPRRIRIVESERKKSLNLRSRVERLGQPFDLNFVDAIKGTQISMEKLRGKVVVIDFWATWCGPCIEEMPRMKKLYAEYKDKGVEFIGVSLDHPVEKGGLEKLKDYVATNGIEWPQFYQGNYFDSEFSKSWEITSIPSVFMIDADGKLASVEARGRLEELIPKLLGKLKAVSDPTGR